VRLNDLFDRLPRSHLRLGDAVVPTYLVLGLAGITAGIVALIAVVLLARLSLLVALSLVPIGAATLVISTLLRRLITGVEKLVLLEQLALVLGAAAAALHVVGIAERPYLDALTVGLALFIAFGRIGCLVGGCCYGRAASVGICYPAECGHAARVRRLPLQLVEAGVWLVLTAIAAALAIARTDGSATAATLVGYGVARLALDPLRGDTRRRFLGATEGQWLSVAAIGAGVALTEGELPPTPALELAGAALVLLFVAIATARRWLARDRGFGDAERAAIRALATELRGTQLDERVQTWHAASLVFAASAVGEARVLMSVSSPDRPLVRAEASLALATLCEAFGAPLDHELIERARGVFATDVTLPAP
jgi:Prolipoprotein diacylglyceryl transferase